MAKIASQTQWEDLASRIKSKQDQLTAGNNISIVTDPYTDTTVISATGGTTTLSAGTGIDAAELANNTVEVDGTVVMYQTPGTTPGSVAYVGTNNITDNAVTTNKLNNASVTTAKIANGAVTSDKIDFATLGNAIAGETDFKITSFSGGIGSWTGAIPLPKSFEKSPKLIFSLSMPAASGYYAGIPYVLKYDKDKIYQIDVYRPGQSDGAVDYTYHLAFLALE